MVGRRRAEAPGHGLGELKAGSQEGLGLAQRQHQTAEYLVDIILELRNLARTAQLYTVMVPLEYAYYEAFTAAHKVEVSPEDVERVRSLSKAGEEFDQRA